MIGPLSRGLRLQIARTTSNPRRMTVIVVLLLLVASLALWTLLESAPRVAVTQRYGSVRILPVETRVCRGGTVSFPVLVIIDETEIPNQIEVAEAWCAEGLDGVCFGVQPGGMDVNAKRIPLLEPRHIERVAKRVVPESLTPGVYHFWHSSIDKNNSVQSYIVAPITVQDCQP